VPSLCFVLSRMKDLAIITLLTLCFMFVILVATGRSSRVWASDRIGGGFGLSQLAPLQFSALHRPIMGMRFFVILGAGTTEEEENWLTVFSHDADPYSTGWIRKWNLFRNSGVIEDNGGIKGRHPINICIACGPSASGFPTTSNSLLADNPFLRLINNGSSGRPVIKTPMEGAPFMTNLEPTFSLQSDRSGITSKPISSPTPSPARVSIITSRLGKFLHESATAFFSSADSGLPYVTASNSAALSLASAARAFASARCDSASLALAYDAAASFSAFAARSLDWVASRCAYLARSSASAIRVCCSVRIWSAISSALVPCHLSSAIPANTASPTTTTIIPRTASKCAYHLRKGLVALLPRNNGNISGRSGQRTSIRNSARTPIKRISLPTSRHHRCSASAGSRSWFIPDSSWTLQDYRESDRRLKHFGDVLLVFICVLWVFRVARTGRPF